MNWRQHIIFALFFYGISLATLYFVGGFPRPEVAALGALVTVFYGLLPDIDTDKSRIHNLVFPLFLVAAVASAVLFLASQATVFLAAFAVLVVLALALKFLHHRGFTHTLRFGFLAALPLFVLGPYYGLFAVVAFLSHLVADMQLRL